MTEPSPVVRICARHTLRPACPIYGSPSTHFLGPSDFLVAPFIPTQVVFVYRNVPARASQPTNPISSGSGLHLSRLQTALSLLLDSYPHLSGRLHTNAEDHTCEIVDIGKGCELFEARCDASLDSQIGGQKECGAYDLRSLPNGGNALLPPYDFTPPALYEEAFFAVQHTTFACGSVALGLRISHAVCDGIGFFQVAKDLAGLYRRLSDESAGGGDGVSSLAAAPYIQSYLSEYSRERMPEGIREGALRFSPTRYKLAGEGSDLATPAGDTPSDSSTSATPAAPPPITGRYILYKPAQIARLKRLAVQPGDSTAWVSTFTALTAHLYRTIVQARLRLRQDDPSQSPMTAPNFLCPVDFRQRLGLPARYCANALTHTLISPPVDLLQNGGLHEIASLIHGGISPSSPQNSANEIHDTLLWIAAQPDKSKIQMRFEHGNGAVMLSAWNKMDMYGGMKFEVEPVLVGPPFTPIILVDGLGYYLPATDKQERKEGGLTVALALSDPVWKHFADLEEAFFSEMLAA